MKKFIIIIFIFFSQINFGIANNSIVFVDMDKIMTTSKPGVSILNQLKKMNAQISKNFNNDGKTLKEKETKLIAQKNILSEEEFQSKVSQLKIEIDKFNKDRKNSINDFNKLKITNRTKFLKMVNSILIKYSDEKSISMIFPKKSMIIGKSELDITDEIIKVINSEIKEFKIK